MRIIAFTLGLGVLLSISGCVHKAAPPNAKAQGARPIFITHMGDFVVQGEVRDADTGEAVPYARVNFIDTGLDYHYGKEALSKRAGTANRDGSIDQRIHYGWCVETSFDALGAEPPDPSEAPSDDRPDVRLEALLAALDGADLPQRFTIEVRNAGYEPHRAEFDIRALSEVEDGYLVDLGDVALVPRQEATLGSTLETDAIRLEP